MRPQFRCFVPYLVFWILSDVKTIKQKPNKLAEVFKICVICLKNRCSNQRFGIFSIADITT